MTLSRFTVTCSFCAWSPADREYPERRISIAPGSKNLFTDETGASGLFIKFLKSGSWYEAERNDFLRATAPLSESGEHAVLSERRGA